jgi:putative ATPase
MSDLFQAAGLTPHAPTPLAERLRPQTLGEVVGQEHLLGPEGPIGRMSMILWGPPGTGKTTIARLLAKAGGYEFQQISAVFSGVADLKKAFEQAKMRRLAGQSTLLFVDEIHRFNRAQQDGFLPFVEEGIVTLVGATTENPSFELNGALCCRAARSSCSSGWTTRRWINCWSGPRRMKGKLPLTPEARHALLAHGRRRRPLSADHDRDSVRPAGDDVMLDVQGLAGTLQRARPPTTRAARSTTTSSPPCISRCAAPIRTPPSTGWRGC